MRSVAILPAILITCLALFSSQASAYGTSEQFKGRIFSPGDLKPTDSATTLKVGDKAPEFTLPSIDGGTVSLRDYAGRNNVVISFVPAAWTPVCSEQWPGYNIAEDDFKAHDAVLLGITVDNAATLFAWTQQMGGVWFPVLSDFWPHGQVAKQYGILRSNGTSERAVFIVDKQGVIRYVDVHDINDRPGLEKILTELEKLEK